MLASIDLMEAGLALCLALAALVCLFDRHVARATCAFVLFALLMALAWWWLGAPWLALAEVGLGALLTGASLFYALGAWGHGLRYLCLRDVSLRHPTTAFDTFRGPLSHRFARGVLTLAWCVMVGAVIRIVMPGMAYAPSEHPLMLVAVLLVGTAMGAFALHRHRLRRLLAFNVLGSGVFLLMTGLAGTIEGAQALVGVGLMVAWLGSLLGALLIRHLHVHEDEAQQERTSPVGSVQ
ncbi:hydrogenase subunit MbhD domain-containing protein [Vreelandella sp. EE22]